MGSAHPTNVQSSHRWAYLVGIGPKIVGEVPIALTMSNHTGAHRKVKVVVSAISHNDTEAEDTFPPQEGIWEVAPEGVHWAHGSLSIPLNSPGKYLLLLSVHDLEAEKVVVHRPLLIDEVERGALSDHSGIRNRLRQIHEDLPHGNGSPTV